MRIVLVMFPVPSHYYAIFGLCRQLIAEGHFLVICGEPRMESLVKSQGFTFCAMKSFPFAQKFESLQSPSYLDQMISRITGDLFKKRREEYNRILTSLRPNYILLDSFLSTDFLVLKEISPVDLNLKVVFLQTMLSTSVSSAFPMISRQTFPAQKLRIKFDYLLFRLRLKLRMICERIIYFGYDDASAIKKKLRGTKVDFLRKFAPGFDDVNELILSPAELDFASVVKRDHQHYVGFVPDPDRRPVSSMFEYHLLKRYLSNLRSQKNVTIVYCAFGSFNPAGIESNRVKKLVKKIIEIGIRRPNIFFVVVAGAHATAELKFHELPQNVHLTNFVPQLDILRLADVFITHGGLNSIKEAISCEIPMIVFPFDRVFDSFGNACKVAHFQLGLLGDIDNDDFDDIEKKLEMVRESELHFKARLRQLRIVNESYIRRSFSQTLLEL